MNKMLEELQEADVDVKKTISRFMNNEEIYLTFLNRFPEEKHFFQLKKRISLKLYDEDTLTLVHTLKGLTANLGMNKIYMLSMEMMKEIKNSHYTDIDKLLCEIEKNYNQICSIIKKHNI